MVTESFSIHAEGVSVDTETSMATVRGFSLGELIGEFSAEEILQELDFDDIHDYVIKELSEKED